MRPTRRFFPPIVGLALATFVPGHPGAAQQATPRHQPGAGITLYAPEQHDPYDGMRDREMLEVHYPLPGKSAPAGAVNPATQQLDFFIRSRETEQHNNPTRAVFDHFFAMEVTWT